MAGGYAKLTITQLFVLTFVGVAVVVGALFYALLQSSQRAVVARSEQLREAAAMRVDARIARDLGEAGDVLADVERAIRTSAIDAHTPESAEAPLFTLLLAHPNVADLSLTHPDRWQISVSRKTADPESGVVTRIVRPTGGQFTAELRTRASHAGLHDGAVTRESAADPTAHLTYESTVKEYGRAIWTDLYPLELDRALPEAARRVVVTVQKAFDGADGKPAGVVRVALLASTVDEIAKLPVDDGSGEDPYRVFLCDEKGRLLTRLTPADHLVPSGESGDDLRVAATTLPPEIARALASPKLHEVSARNPVASQAFDVDGRRYLLTLRWLANTQDWIAAILVPEDHYTRDLRALRDRFIAIDAVGALIAILGAGLILASVHSGFRRLLATTAKMRGFELAPDPRPGALRDVDEVVQGLERAKTAMRALGKYVPVDLVRTLYASNKEPELGGELARLTLMFSDIRGFTDLSERITPSELAQALGHYLEAMTTAIRATGGTIDKFIGDSVMALWNAPSPVPGHAVRACRAALACVEANARLYASEAWRGLPALTTRFGLHTDDVLVGNFGAPERFSYTALGDGVNLASRLEGLGKQYGVTCIASEAVEKEAREAFAFRRLDRVAVKGKSRAVLIFELLGHAGMARGGEIAAYESALDHYFARRFDEAIALLGPFAERDAPSKMLLDRCRAFLVTAPSSDWDGTWIARSK